MQQSLINARKNFKNTIENFCNTQKKRLCIFDEKKINPRNFINELITDINRLNFPPVISVCPLYDVPPIKIKIKIPEKNKSSLYIENKNKLLVNICLDSPMEILLGISPSEDMDDEFIAKLGTIDINLEIDSDIDNIVERKDFHIDIRDEIDLLKKHAYHLDWKILKERANDEFTITFSATYKTPGCSKRSTSPKDVKVVPVVGNSMEGHHCPLAKTENKTCEHKSIAFIKEKTYKLFLACDFKDTNFDRLIPCIKEIFSQNNIELIRAGEESCGQPTTGIWCKEVCIPISNFHGLVAEISSPNENVWFEIGCAKARNKPIYLIYKKDEKHYKSIIKAFKNQKIYMYTIDNLYKNIEDIAKKFKPCEAESSDIRFIDASIDEVFIIYPESFRQTCNEIIELDFLDKNNSEEISNNNTSEARIDKIISRVSKYKKILGILDYTQNEVPLQNSTIAYIFGYFFSMESNIAIIKCGDEEIAEKKFFDLEDFSHFIEQPEDIKEYLENIN